VDVEYVNFRPPVSVLTRLIEAGRRMPSPDEDRQGQRLALGQISGQEFLARWADQSSQ
jgi:hypothetical protein